MTALPPEQARAMRQTAEHQKDGGGDPGQRWTSLHVKAKEVAHLAGISAAHQTLDSDAFNAAFGGSHRWQRNLVLQALDDLEALIEIGFRALTVLIERSASPQAPALVLWREWQHANEGVLQMLVPQRDVA